MKKLGNLFILGDSYSTFAGKIAEGCVSWYTGEPREINDVATYDQTWIYKLLESTDTNLVLNCSWSGSTMCHTGYDNKDCSEKVSFCARLRNLAADGFFEKNKIDTVFLFGGLNDSGAKSPLGEINYGEKTEKDLFSVKPAVCYLIETLKEQCKEARIISIVDSGVKKEIAECINEVSAHYGIEVFNLPLIEKKEGHPDIQGMKDIYNYFMENL